MSGLPGSNFDTFKSVPACMCIRCIPVHLVSVPSPHPREMQIASSAVANYETKINIAATAMRFGRALPTVPGTRRSAQEDTCTNHEDCYRGLGK